MNAGFLDVLHDAADEHVAGAVADGIDIHLDRVAQIRVDQHRALARHDHGLGDVAGELRLVVDDLHRSAAEHVRRSDDDREADLDRDRPCLGAGAGDAASRLPELEPLDQRLEVVAVLGEVDRLRRGAEDGDFGILQRLERELGRGSGRRTARSRP